MLDRRAAQELQQKVNTGKVEAAEVNLASMGSIRSFAEDFASKGLPLNCLICNAGVFLPPYAKTEWGSEVRRQGHGQPYDSLAVSVRRKF